MMTSRDDMDCGILMLVVDITVPFPVLFCLMNDTPTSVLDVLRKTRERVATPDLWYKGFYMPDDEYDENGNPVADPDTCPVCLTGAVNYVLTGDPRGFWNKVTEDVMGLYAPTREALEAQTQKHIPTFNDDPGTTHNDILRVVDQAIAAEEARLALAEMVSA